MTDCRWVPVAPTPEMVEAAQDAYMPFGDMELAIRMALLAAPDHIADARKKVDRTLIREVFLRNGFAIKPGHDDLKDYVYEAAFDLLETAAPAVQGEPVGDLPTLMKIEHHSLGITIEKDILGTVHIKVGDFDYIQIQYQYPYTDNATQLRHAMLIADALATPQPAEHRPCPEDIREGAPYDDPAFSALCREHEVWGTAAAAQCAVFWEAGKRVAEQQPAPDVKALVEALEQCITSMLDNGYLANALVIRAARAALAAYRKQEPGHD